VRISRYKAPASVTVDSGEFKLLRNIDIKHQPSRSKVVSEWIKAFDSEVPHALNALADVIEDVYAFPIIWQERRKSGPDEFFKSIGITGLNLEDPARLVKTLRGEMGEEEKTVGCHITEDTKPAVAANKIRATFGDEFAEQLAAALLTESAQ